MNALRERAEVHLLWIAGLPGTRERGPLQRGTSCEQMSARWVREFETAAETLTAVGLLSDEEIAPFRQLLFDEIARWGEEIERLAEDASEPRDAALAGRARELLAAQLEDVEAPSFMTEFSAVRGGRTPQMEAVHQFELLLHACRECRALSPRELEDWRRRLIEVDASRTPSLEHQRRRRLLSQRELLAVVLGDASDASRIGFAAAELYDGGTVLRWHQRDRQIEQESSSGPSAARARLERSSARTPRDPGPPVSLTDDLGTDYLHFVTGEEVLQGPGSWTASFATAVPAAATRLVACIDEQRLTFALREDGG